MFELIINEIYKIIKAKKLYTFMALIFVLSFLYALNTMMANSDYKDLAGDKGISGQTFPILLLENMASIVVPIMIVMIVASLLSGEYSDGTLKLPLLRGITRSELLFSKVVAVIFTLTVINICICLCGYLLGFLVVGWGDCFELKGITMSTFEGIMFTLLIYILSLIPFSAFSLIICYVSIMVTVEGLVVGLGIGIIVIMMVIGQLFSMLHLFLINTYFCIFGFVSSSEKFIDIIFGIIVVFAYLFLFYIMSLLSIKKKDILS